MKLFLYFLLTFCCINSFCQDHSGKVVYDISFSAKNAIPENYIGELIFNSNKASLFVYDKNSFITPSRKDSVASNGQMLIALSKGRVSDNIGKVVFTDFAKNIQVSREFIGRKAFIVNDTVVPAIWVLTGETKKMGNYNSQKAKARYYGRDYEVWFTTDIPVAFGPWKLNGLPGLILEAKSGDGEVSFVANSVKLTAIKDLIEPPKSGEELEGYLEFRTLQDKKTEDLKKYAQSMVNDQNNKPGGKMTLGDVKVSRFEESLE